MSMESELTCSICLEIYTDPLQLSCLHSYCRQCLKDIHAKTQETLGAVGGTDSETEVLKCPDCRKTTTLENGIDGLPKNFMVGNIAAKFKQSQQTTKKPVVLCSLCETDPKPAVKTCRDCSDTNYCVDCLQQCHPARGAFKKHVLCEPGDAGEDITGPMNDGDVDEKVVFCSTCSTVTSETSRQDHRNHSIQGLDIAVKSQQTQLHILLQELLTRRDTEQNKLQIQTQDYQKKKDDVDAISRLLTKTGDTAQSDYSQYKDTVQQYITDVEAIVQAAQGLGSDHPDSTAMVAYLRGVTDIKSQIKRLNIPRSFEIGHSSLQSFRDNLAADIGQILEKSIPSSERFESASSKPNAVINIKEIKNIPSKFDTASVQMTWVSNCTDLTYRVTCRHVRTQDSYSAVEEVCLNLTGCGVEVKGLRPSTLYKAVVTGTDPQGRIVTAEDEFTTGPKIFSKPNAVISIKEIKNVPSNQDTTSVKMTWVSNCTDLTYNVTCRHVRTQDIYSAVEEVCMNLTGCCVEVKGLRYSTLYKAVVTGTDPQGRIVTAEDEFTTGRKIHCPLFWWFRNVYHPSLALSEDERLLIPKIHKKSVKGKWSHNEGDWHKGHGACSSLIYDDESNYWEALIKYQVLKHLDDDSLILDIGICQTNKKDAFSPLCNNYGSLCYSLYKPSGKSAIAVDFWDGRDRSTSSSTVVSKLGGRKENSLTLGFYLDFTTNTFKIVDVEKNTLLFVYTSLNYKEYVAVCEFYHEEYVRTSVELHTESDISSVPSVLFD